MREFFRGWKRKAGVVTLLMACVCMALWFKSYFRGDAIRCERAHHWLDCRLSSGIAWISYGYELVGNQDPTAIYLTWHDLRPDWMEDFNKDDRGEGGWSRSVASFSVGVETNRYGNTDVNCPFLTSPIWFFTLMIATLSAWLLLSKPRQQPKPPVPHGMAESDRRKVLELGEKLGSRE